MTALVLAMAVALWAASAHPVHRRPGPTPPPRVRPAPRRRSGGASSAAEWARLLDDIAARVRGGSTLRVAVAEAGALSQAPAPTGTDGAVVVQVLGLAVQLGGATATIVQAGAALLRERVGAREEALAHAAQARLSARVLTTVPLAFTAWSAIVSSSFRAALATPAGTAALIAGSCCNLVGWWWMRRIVRAATR